VLTWRQGCSWCVALESCQLQLQLSQQDQPQRHALRLQAVSKQPLCPCGWGQDGQDGPEAAPDDQQPPLTSQIIAAASETVLLSAVVSTQVHPCSHQTAGCEGMLSLLPARCICCGRLRCIGCMIGKLHGRLLLKMLLITCTVLRQLQLRACLGPQAYPKMSWCD
jgi:hypothetical protein